MDIFDLWIFRDDADRLAEAMPWEVGLEFVRLLTRSDIYLLAAGTNWPRDIRRTVYFAATIMIEATDGVGTHYLAVEANRIATRRDCEKAQRNARLITQLTGMPAHAGVASVQNDPEATELVESGAVFWCPMKDRSKRLREFDWDQFPQHDRLPSP